MCMAMAIALCIGLSACGNTDDVTGDDRRASGDVAGSGTITHDGESVNVLVTISPSSAAFYRDIAEQVLFDSVSFPMNIADAEQAFNAISFDDMDGDRESDVLVSFIHENGDETELIWIWDPVERYVYREELSTVPGEEETFFLNYDEQTEEPYFTANGLEMNAAAEMGTFLLEDGICTYTGLGDGSRGDNYYLHSVQWDGKEYLIEFAYSTDCQYDVGDWAQVLTKSYVVYIPEDYYRLVFAAESQPDNYRESAKRMQLDSIAPEAAILGIDTLYPYSNLYFSLCY